MLILLLGFISLFLKLYILSGVLGVFSIILLFTSCIYLIAKYSVNRKLRIPSFYGVIIFFVIIGFALHLFGSSLISQFDDFEYYVDYLEEVLVAYCKHYGSKFVPI